MALHSFEIREKYGVTDCEMLASFSTFIFAFQVISSETFGLNAIAYQRESPIQRIVFKVQMLAFIVILITGIRLHRFRAKNFCHLQWNSSD